MISPDLDNGTVPKDPKNFQIFIEVEIGPKGQKSSDIFSLTAITPSSISANQGPIWGHGYLIMPVFSWQNVERSLNLLMMHCSGENWEEVVKKLRRELNWEFDNYYT
ncbi:MAG: Imm8 family immunity protein [Pseudomonadota bacterium]